MRRLSEAKGLQDMADTDTEDSGDIVADPRWEDEDHEEPMQEEFVPAFSYPWRFPTSELMNCFVADMKLDKLCADKPSYIRDVHFLKLSVDGLLDIAAHPDRYHRLPSFHGVPVSLYKAIVHKAFDDTIRQFKAYSRIPNDILDNTKLTFNDRTLTVHFDERMWDDETVLRVLETSND